MLTQRDRSIIRHIEQYGFITNQQARELYVPRNVVKGYEAARRRLKYIIDNNITFTIKEKPLKITTNKVTGKPVFHYKNQPSYHDIVVMDFYARLVFMGVNVLKFKKHVEWLGGTYISDAFLAYEVDGKKTIALLEVCYANQDPHIEGYEALHKTNELQKKFKGAFPRIILVGHKGEIPETFLKVTSIKEDLTDIFKILN